jgi:hypothetical protein
MYSGTTFRRDSGRIVGVHQKIVRVARRHLTKSISELINFPNTSSILYFEGKNGPDALKHMGSTGEPWHFIDPTKPNDRDLLVSIDNHIYNLSKALKSNDSIRSSFEAAWLAHAIVDGLTPAHHYPWDDKVAELWGKPRNELSTIKEKNIIHGANKLDTLSKNWKYWGAGGVLTAHLMFELGVASAISMDKFNSCGPTRTDINRLKNDGFEAVFMGAVSKVYKMKMYDEFCKKGWTRHLAVETRKELVPEIIKTVALAWLQSVIMATEPD